MSDTPGDGRTATLHVAVVHAGDEICFLTAAASAEGLARRVGTYVREQVRYQLEASDAARVLHLLEADRTEEAIDLYFEEAGRWAPDRLVTKRVPLADRATAVRAG